MTNHLHLLCSFHGKQEPVLVLKNRKSYTAMKLIAAIIKNPKESRREYVLNLFETAGKKSSSNFRFKFWEHENHPVIPDSAIVFNQKINDLHWNPVTAGFVTEPWYWKYSRAVNYMTKEKGLLDWVMLA
jgi:putative transposase